MNCFVIKKWIEPYKLLETVKKYYQFKDFTFDGLSKQYQKSLFLQELQNSEFNIGLYMKNVNKFYLFSRSQEFDIINSLIEFFQFESEDFILNKDIEYAFNLIDLGKAEAVVILN